MVGRACGVAGVLPGTACEPRMTTVGSQDTTVADYQQGYTFTSGPLAAHGKVVAGISGCTNPGTGSGCFIVALDAKTGAEVWRTKTIAQPGSPGDDSWHGLPAEKRNGGSVWTSGSYDPALNLVYWGTGGPIPHSEIVRGTGDGAVLYTDSTLALDADTGKIVWYHQFLPRDNWNLDHVFEQVLADIEVDGHPRQVLLTIGKPGIIWALDRRTGEFLWERETSYQTVYKHIDAETGQVALNKASFRKSSMRPNLFVRRSMAASCGWRAPMIRPQKRCSCR
jgi:glucose dehydrogenase